MSWDTDTGGRETWNAEPTTGGNSWGADDAGNAGGDSWGGGDAAAADAGGDTCRVCNQPGHFARDCPEKPAGGGLTGECYNCGQVGHNKADCTNPRVERAFNGTCNACQVEGHAARDCPSQKCKLCDQPGHKALNCTQRRVVNWSGIPELTSEEAWKKLIDAATAKDLDTFRICLRAYARAAIDQFDLPSVETALREDKSPVYLIAKQQTIAPNMTIVDLIGNPEREWVLTFQFAAKPRRAKLAEGWPESPEKNLERLASAGFVEDRGVPLCNNCGELGHIRKHCKQEQPEQLSTQPVIQCVNCQEEGHRARDCFKERVNPFACRNCKQEGHTAKDCTEPRSAEGVECKKCSEIGHFSRDCPKAEVRTCRNCGSADHMAKECDQPRNPATVTCRNCDEVGHFSRDCPKPKDWSKVQCQNCKEFGHTIKRCKAPVAEYGADGDGDGNANAGGDASGWETPDKTPADGEASWGGDTGGASGW